MNKTTKAITVAGAGLLLAASAIAHGDDATVRTSTAAEAMSNQIVVRDAETGKLRAATAAEARALNGARATGESAVGTRAPLDTLQRSHATGAHGVRLSDAFMSYSVVVRTPDGKLIEQCFATKEEADAAQKAASAAFSKTTALPTE